LEAAPLLARLYDPRDFGILSVYAAVLSVLVAIASLRFDFAIPISADPLEAVHLLAVSVMLAFGASIIVGLVVLIWGAQMATALGAASLAPFLWLLPIARLAASATQALGSWAVYYRLFATLGRLRAVQGVALAACQAAFGFVGAGTFGLILERGEPHQLSSAGRQARTRELGIHSGRIGAKGLFARIRSHDPLADRRTYSTFPYSCAPQHRCPLEIPACRIRDPCGNWYGLRGGSRR
jgi:hypothetical protein